MPRRSRTKQQRRPTRTRGKTPLNRWDIPVVIRVSDEDNALIPHVEVARAIGFVKAKARQLTKLLWRDSSQSSARNNLPNRTYYWAMPGSEIAIIELKTNPREQSWHARIIGGKRLGQFIWIPTDDVDGDKDQILVKAEGFEGPYEVFKDNDLVAGNIDWKGPTRTKDANGDPLVDPRQITDVITWRGPENRVHQMGSVAGMTTSTFKDGAEYATAPNDDGVLGAAIQGLIAEEEGDPGRRDVMICLDSSTFSLSGGPEGIGVLKFNIYVRPEAALIDGSLIDPTPFDPEDNPNGWKLIATLDAFDDIAAERWTRTRMWYFNRDGTQASAMLPSNIDADSVGAGAPIVRRNISPAVGNEPELHPMHLRLATININAFAETATISFEAREPIFETTKVGEVTECSASGSFANFCQGPPVGSYTTLRTETAITTHSGGPRRVAVDYIGNTRVFATMNLITGAGTSTVASTNETHTGNPGFGTCPGASGDINPTDVDIDGSIEGTSKFGYELRVGTSVVPIWHEETTTSSAISLNNNNSDGTFDEVEVESTFNQVGIVWLDLRVGLVIYSESSHLLAGRKGDQGFPFGSDADNIKMLFNHPAEQVSQRNARIKAVRGGNTLAEYAEGATRGNVGVGLATYPRTRIQGTTTPTATPCMVGPINCTINFSNTSFSPLPGDCDFLKGFTSFGIVPVTTEEIPISLESLTDRDDNLASFPSNESNFNRQGTAQTDTARNTAFSFETFEGVVVGASGGDPEFTYPGPKWLNFIHGDDLIDVSNQVEYFDDGPDMMPGTPDDILRPPVEVDTGRAKNVGWNGAVGAGSIKIL